MENLNDLKYTKDGLPFSTTKKNGVFSEFSNTETVVTKRMSIIKKTLISLYYYYHFFFDTSMFTSST